MKFINATVAENFNEIIQEEELLNSKAASVLYIVPTNRSVLALRKQLLQNPALNPASFPHIFTLDGLAKLILQRIKKFRLVSDAGGLAILKRIVKDSNSQYFSNSRGEMPHGTLRQLRSMFISMKRKGVDANDLIMTPVEETTQAKYFEFCELYKSYCSEFEIGTFYEIADVYRELLNLDTSVLGLEVSNLLGQIKFIKIIWFTGFTFNEAEFLNRIAASAGATAVVDYDTGQNAELFAAAEQVAANLETAGFKSYNSIPENDTRKRKHLRKYLFSAFQPEKKLEAKFFQLQNCSSRADEVEKIAHQICHLIKEENVKPEQIAVGFKLINEYSVHIRKIFRDYGIPFDLTDRFSLSDNIIAGKIFSLLRLHESNFFYQDIEAVYGYFKGGLLTGSASFMLEFAKRYKVLTDPDKWLSVLDEQINKAVTKSAFRDETKILKMRMLKQDIETLVEILTCFKNKLSPEEFRKGVLNLLSRTGYPAELFSADYEQIMLNTQAYKQLITVLDELTAIETAEFDGREGKSAQEYVAQLRTAFYEARYNFPKGYFSGVLITTFEELRGLQYDYVFFAGMYEGNFPAKYARDIIAVEKNSSAEKRYLSEQRYLFYQLLAHFRGRIIFSSPTREESKEFSESHFLFHLRRSCIINKADQNNRVYSLTKMKLEEGKKYRGVFLETATDSLTKSLTVDRERSGNKSVYNGYLESSADTVKTVIERISGKTFSYSSLDVLVNCPYRFFLQEILRLRPEELPDDELQANETGTILHRILKKYIGELISEEKAIADVLGNSAEENRLFEIAAEELRNEFKELPPLSQFELEKITGIDGDKNESLLNIFLESEKQLEEKYQRRPAYLEKSFGGEGQTRVNIGGFNVRGQIDRIDVYTNEGEDYLAITDYKTGAAPGLQPTPMADKKLLQLPMYAMAINKLNESTEQYRSVGSLFYNIIKFSKDNGYIEFGNKKISQWLITFREKYPDFVNTTEEQPAVFLEMTEYILKELFEKMISGTFHLVSDLTPKSTECNYCGFYTICRKHEQFEA